jgi:predicted RNase H-like nuclease (RuvC/YqgF family)
MENKRATEGRIIELQSDNQQQATHIKDLEDQLGELPQ